MTYNKPMVLTLGSAVELIQQVNGEKEEHNADSISALSCYVHELDD